MFGLFHSSRFFWKMFVCLPPSHSLCTAFRKTRSALPRDVSGVRSANPCLPSQGRSGRLPFSSCVPAVESRSEAAPFPGSSSSDLPLLKPGVPAGRRDRQECSLVCCLLLPWSPHPWGLGRVGVRDRQQQAVLSEADFLPLWCQV